MNLWSPSLLSLYLLLLPTLILTSAAPSTDYHEQLLLRPLPPSALLASFNFRSNTTAASFESQNFRFFPRSLGQILHHARTKELHLRFSLGRWDAESWGARPWGGAREGGTGVELWAWVEATSDDEADAHWLTLTNALSGLFCASLNFIDSTRTVRPVRSFEPWGQHPSSSLPNLHLLHGTLPKEPVCTENLTPFLKLLPCKGKVGISSLLDGHKLFDASWQSMAIDVRPLCPDGGAGTDECLLEIDQTVDMVLDIDRSKRHRDNPIPRPVPVEDLVCNTSIPYYSHGACLPLDDSSDPSWSLSEIFGRTIHGSCPLTQRSGSEAETVCIEVPHERQVYTSAGSVERKLEDNQFRRCYVLPDVDEFEMVLPLGPPTIATPLTQPLLYAERSFTGHGQERGGVQTLLTNPSTSHAVSFVYLETLPWFMKPYLHTLIARISSPSTSSIPTDQPPTSKETKDEDIIQEMFYRPALDRHRPTHLELMMTVPPNSTVTLTYDFDKAILRYTEYPPDANRGFDVAPAIIRLLPTSSSPSSSENQYIHTTTLLLSLPTPDFSMPYNVIILTSTVMALAFGSVFNLLVRRFVGAEEVEAWALKAKIRRVVGRGREFWVGGDEKVVVQRGGGGVGKKDL
ncbi:MAG: Subunit of the glycosylphosphatidylinositol transamidase complex-like protein [Caeruleum heppii]|nr:MAG: Subunit of the glycosylphosphatidylinositol transamidase complex-like protein [Caeruleum heppii]